MACRASIHLPRREAQGHGLTLPAVTARPACCCSASGTHRIHLIFWHPPLPFPSPCCISFSASLPSHTTSRAAPWLWLTELSSRFSLTLTGRAGPLAAGSASVPRTALHSYSSKSPARRSTSQPGTTQLLPRAQAAASCQLGAMLGSKEGKAAPVSQASCDAPGDAGS